jgi:hypothetical protein
LPAKRIDLFASKQKKKKEVRKNVGCYDGFDRRVPVSRRVWLGFLRWLARLGLCDLQSKESQERKK